MYYGKDIAFFYFAFSVRLAKNLLKMPNGHNALSIKGRLLFILSCLYNYLAPHYLATDQFLKDTKS